MDITSGFEMRKNLATHTRIYNCTYQPFQPYKLMNTVVEALIQHHFIICEFWMMLS